jgi:hypothetical protein
LNTSVSILVQWFGTCSSLAEVWSPTLASMAVGYAVASESRFGMLYECVRSPLMLRDDTGSVVRNLFNSIETKVMISICIYINEHSTNEYFTDPPSPSSSPTG